MAKRGRSSTKGNLPMMVGGIIGGVVLDAVYASLGLPGGNEDLGQCSMLTVGDAFQLGGEGSLTMFAILANSNQLAAFSSGLLLGGLLPKIVFPAFNLPRYGLFDFDPKSGSLSPIGRYEGPTEGSANPPRIETPTVQAPEPGPNIEGVPMKTIGGTPAASRARTRSYGSLGWWY